MSKFKIITFLLFVVVQCVHSSDYMMTMVEKHGYPAERYRVVTKDDYILTLYRIPYSPRSSTAGRKVPVFLQNPMFGCSADYVVSGVGRAIALILADAGYDVWLANSRSSRFSRQHKYLSATSPKYWQFDWHEIGVYDIPASIDFVLKHTGHKALHFIGSSEGTTTFFVMASVLPEYNSKILTMHALGPTAFMAHSQVTMIQMFKRPAFRSFMKLLHQLSGNREFLPEWLVTRFCKPILRQCSEWLTAGNGLNLAQHNDSLLPDIWMHSPNGAAFRQIEHYGQLVESGRFCWFDHGRKQNMKLYGSPIPPDYELNKITAPVYLYCSTGDATAVVEDVNKLANELGNCVEQRLVADEMFTHFDYLFGNHANTLVYDNIIRTMNETVVPS